MDVDQLVAARVRELRTASKLTLEHLAEISGVSRSTISSIERIETSTTAAVLNKLAKAFGIPLAQLFAEASSDQPQSPLARHAEQLTWIDPGSGYVRRQVSPPGYPMPLDLVEVTFPAGKSVVFDGPPRDMAYHQLIWQLDGEMEVSVGGETHRLQAGDCLAVVVDKPITFRNSTRKPARYAVVLTHKSMRSF